LQKQLSAIPEGLSEQVPMRKISLKSIDLAVRQCLEEQRPIPDAIRYLGGLQSISYVVVKPDENDLVLVGPAEGWTVSAEGTVVGQSTGAPVLQLEDLATALRVSNTQRPEVITCSIDPTQQGLVRMQNLMRKVPRGANPARVAQALEENLGMQQVTLTGVPAGSRFAQVLVAADYRMKRIGLDLEPAPIARFPSYMQMLSGSRKVISPRFWLAPVYQTVSHDPEKLVWNIEGLEVQTLTQNEYVDTRGIRHESDRTDLTAEKWAELMTERYDELAKADPVFAELKNCMDLALVAALVFREGLIQKSGCELPALLDANVLALPEYAAPKEIASRASIVKKGRHTLIGTGGVEINPWTALEETTENAKLVQLQKQVSFDGSQWWAN
jgi:hypothetical protein